MVKNAFWNYLHRFFFLTEFLIFFLFSLLGKRFEGNVRNQIFPIWNLNFRKICAKTRYAPNVPQSFGARSGSFWVSNFIRYYQISSVFDILFNHFFFTLRGLNFLDTNPLQVLPDGTKNDRTFKFELFCVTNKKITNILTEKNLIRACHDRNGQVIGTLSALLL